LYSHLIFFSVSFQHGESTLTIAANPEMEYHCRVLKPVMDNGSVLSLEEMHKYADITNDKDSMFSSKIDLVGAWERLHKHMIAISAKTKGLVSLNSDGIAELKDVCVSVLFCYLFR